MILPARPERYDGSWRIVSVAVGASGALEPTLSPLATHDEVHLSYVARHKESLRLLEEVKAGRASPLALHLQLNRMTADALASFTGLSRRVVARHLEPQGFGSATVDELRRYARVFDIQVADFFGFVRLPDGVAATVSAHQDQLVQVVELALTPPEPPPIP